MALVKVKVDINDKAIDERLSALMDNNTMLAIHNALARYCDPYVPFLEGPLSQTIQVEPTGVTYNQPYARYQYYGTHFKHTTDFHPKATALWDQVMMSERGDEFKAEVEGILRWRLQEIYG